MTIRRRSKRSTIAPVVAINGARAVTARPLTADDGFRSPTKTLAQRRSRSSGHLRWRRCSRRHSSAPAPPSFTALVPRDDRAAIDARQTTLARRRSRSCVHRRRRSRRRRSRRLLRRHSSTAMPPSMTALPSHDDRAAIDGRRRPSAASDDVRAATLAPIDFGARLVVGGAACSQRHSSAPAAPSMTAFSFLPFER